jgi:DNA polymerase-3 subunit alpha
MHSGNHNLKFVIYDDEEELKLEMKSRLQKIKISQELLEELKSQEVFYKLN